jgi:hypothetical protein
VTDGGGPDPAGPEQLRIRPYMWVGAAPPPPRAAVGGAAPPPQAAAERPRPFVLTAGRVRAADPDIGMETQVTRRTPPPEAVPVASLAPELQEIVLLCADPVSVAEISARVPLHLGVARILVSDLRASGYLDVHAMYPADPSDPHLILRVIRGLRALC